MNPVKQVVVLDNEAVQALAEPRHRKHRRVLQHVQVVADRKRRVQPVQLLVPTTVRVEAGWDRDAPAAATINRFRIADRCLDEASANTAARLTSAYGVSVADAHIGAIINGLGGGTQAVVITSDPDDIRGVAENTLVQIVTV